MASGHTGYALMNVSHRNSFFFHLESNHKPTLRVKHEEINARKRGLWNMNFIKNSSILSTSAYVTKIFVAVSKREYRRLFKIVDFLQVLAFRLLAWYMHLNAFESKTTPCETLLKFDEFKFDTKD